MILSRNTEKAPVGGRCADIVRVVVMAVIMVFATAFATVHADEDKTCLSCHGHEGLEKKLTSGETLSLHVRGDRFAKSIHAAVGCRGCHGDVDLKTHASKKKQIASKKAYRKQASKVCSQCHESKDLRAGPGPHARVLKTGKPACVACHKVHTSGGIAEWKNNIDETTYCLTCHGQALDIPQADGEVRSLSVSAAALRGSVHLDHDCSDCHSGFSKTAHISGADPPTETGAASRIEICRQCHEDKFEPIEGGMHAMLVKDGNPAAPGCTDCHGAHSVSPKAALETITGVPCKQCHAPIFDAYAASVHGRARSERDHFAAPICADCHSAHNVSTASLGDRLRTACLGCHESAVPAHKKWLPNAALHLETIACPACHAPTAQRRVDLRLFDSATRERISGAVDATWFDDRVRALARKGNALDALTLWELLREFDRTDDQGKTTLRGRLEVRTGVGAHMLSDKSLAVRNCDSCHREGAEPFQSVTVSVIGPDGRPVRFGADKDVLKSAISVDSLGGFYAIGGTRIELLDALFVLALAGGASVPVGHLTLKWFFRRYSKKNDSKATPQNAGAQDRSESGALE